MLAALATLFVISGAAGLFYEAVWSRYLALFVGHDAYAQVLTLVIFLGGMGLGALLVSRRSSRLGDPLVAYAIVEALIGVIGLVFHDGIYLPVTGWAHDAVFPALAGSPLLGLAKWGLAGLLILPQSVLLGATFPLMSAGVLRRLPDDPGRTLAVLYFANSLGAAIGVLVAGFLLFAVAGLPGTVIAAAGLNLLVALGAMVAARTSALPHSRTSPLPHSRTPALLLLLATGTALASFIYEIGWLRMLSMVIGSSTHSFELMLSAFILGLALGAWWIRRRADRLADPFRTLVTVQLVMGALALLTVPLYAQSFSWTAWLVQATARTEPGYLLFTGARFLICLALMLPATFCAGMTLPLITRVLLTGGSGEAAIGAVYGANTIGSIVGAALAGLVLLPAIGLQGTLIAGGLLDVALGLLLLLSFRTSPLPHFRTSALPLLLAALATLAAVTVRWDQHLLSSGVFRVGRVADPAQKTMVFHADGRTATVHTARLNSSGTLILSTNGKPDGSLSTTWYEACDAVGPLRAWSGDDGTQVGLALVLLAHAPRAERGAVIGLGTGMSSHFLLASPALRQLSTIEIEPAMLGGAGVFRPANRRVFEDPRSRIVIDDARSFFAAADTTFDLILSEPSNPWVSGVSGLFTTEFYGRIVRYLAPGGVFGQWLHTYELNDGLVLGVLAALHQHFADYRVYLLSAGDLIVVATPKGRLPAPDWSVAGLPEVRRDLCRFQPLTPAALDRTLVLDRAGIAPVLERGAQPNSDFYPVLDLGAERARFLQQLAIGLANLGSGVVGYVRDPALRVTGFDTASTSILTPAPGVRAMLLAAAMRRPGTDPGWSDGLGSSERALQASWLGGVAGGTAPGSWRSWTTDFWSIRRARAGGTALPDPAFFAAVTAYLARVEAPPPVRAAVTLGEALSARELTAPGAADAAELLVAEGSQGRLWVPADDLMDAAVRVLLAVGRPERARYAFQVTRSASTRGAGDLRLLLLDSYIEAARSRAPGTGKGG